MSGREDPKRHRSRVDQQPSPKRCRRDGKVESESGPDKRFNGRNQGPKKPRSYSQHDDRDHSAPAATNFRRRDATDRGWWKDSREQHGERSSRTAALHTRQKQNKVKGQGEEDGAWRHDKFSDLHSEPNSTSKKRPAFREQKMDAEAERTAANPPKPNNFELHASESEKNFEREGHNYRSWDRHERPTTGERGEANRKTKFVSSDRYGNDNRRDRFAARQGDRLGGRRVDKWKHDLFHESNSSLPAKSDEDQIAKVEALLAS